MISLNLSSYFFFVVILHLLSSLLRPVASCIIQTDHYKNGNQNSKCTPCPSGSITHPPNDGSLQSSVLDEE